MKKILKILLFTSILLGSLFNSNLIYAENIDWLSRELKSSENYHKLTNKNDLTKSTEDIVYKVIDIVRVVFSGILVIFIVYAWAQMIMSMGKEEEELSKAKRSFRYALIWIIFINFPIDIYEWLTNNISWWWWNFYVVWTSFRNIIDAIVLFLEIAIAWIAVFMIVLTWVQIITSRWREEKLSEAKNKIIWVVVALIFVWFIEAWRSFIVAEGWLNMNFWITIFQKISNLALYLAWPVALFFLTLAWYYYITASWDEEKAKKGKNIIVNTLIWVIILLCAYVLLNDLSLLII